MRDLFLQGRGLILRNAEENRDTARFLHRGSNPVAVRVDNLVFVESFIEVSELIPGRQHRHPRFLINQHERLGQDGQHAGLGRADRRALGNDTVPFLDIFALETNVPTPFDLLEDADCVADRFGLLHLHDCSGPVGDRGAGHDADRLPGPDCLRRHLSSLHILDDREFNRLRDRVLLFDILPAHREPVHGRVVPRRIIPARNDIFAQHTAYRVQQTHLFEPERLRRLEDCPLSLF